MMTVLVGELVIRDLLLSFVSSPCDRTILRRQAEQRMCQNRPMRGTSKNARITRVSDVTAWFGAIVTKNA